MRRAAQLWRPLAFACSADPGRRRPGGAVLPAIFLPPYVRRSATYVERLLDPPVLEQELPSGDDDLGLLARSLSAQRRESANWWTT